MYEAVGPPQCPLLNGRPSCSRDRTYVIGVGFNGRGRPYIVGHAETGGFTRRVAAAGDRVVVLTDASLVLVDPADMRLLDSLKIRGGAGAK